MNGTFLDTHFFCLASPRLASLSFSGFATSSAFVSCWADSETNGGIAIHAPPQSKLTSTPHSNTKDMEKIKNLQVTSFTQTN